MVRTIEMQDMRYLNLFERVTNIRTGFCFKYNETIIFCVPQAMISKAIGPEGKNVRRLHEILGKRIKVIASPRSEIDARKFIESIVSPVTFKEIDITDSEVILTAGSQNKAALIGRNKRRLIEMQKVIGDFFNKEFRIV
jgi:NusA-like KH domain protein